ncbi:alginate export family protein [Granulicella sp. S156]|uniref:alginate export family protein n=1 Tax=Granulicella sp. S156 TaxID=1747224 RepID=UPI00131D1994|nr:alginate export family protein [Granulicella sp. S156]
MTTNLFCNKLHLATRISAIALAAIVAFSAVHAIAQSTIYADYPQKRGKVEPLQWNDLPSWMTLSMELRGRTEGQTSYNYTQDGDRIYELTRAYGALEIRPTSFFTGYLQFIDTHALGLPTHVVASNMRDAFDLRQGYADLHGRPGGIPVDLFAGRQELKFGSERIIGISDWTNNSRTWDGFDARIGDKNRIDLFSTSVVAVHPTSLDKHGAGLTFHGAYGSISTWIPKVHLSPYVLIHTVRGVTSNQNIKGNEVETTFGTEVEGTLPANFDYEANASLQRGSYSNNSIHAGQNFDKLAYTMETLPWKPRIGGEFDYATGNDHTNANRIGTYDQSYPSNHNAFGLVDLFGYQNIRQERINLDLGPSKNLSILVQGGFLNLAQKNDSLYSSSASVVIKPPTGGFATDDIGQEFDASAKYVFHDYIVANVGVGHLFPGKVLLDNKHGAAETIGYFSLTYRFRVDKQTQNPGKQN